MLSKIREILLTQYIGSILIALLVWQAAIEVITTVVRTGFWLYNHSQHDSVLGGSISRPFPWDNMIFAALSVALYLLTARAIARWLYPQAATQTSEEIEPSPDHTEQT